MVFPSSTNRAALFGRLRNLPAAYIFGTPLHCQASQNSTKLRTVIRAKICRMAITLLQMFGFSTMAERKVIGKCVVRKIHEQTAKTRPCPTLYAALTWRASENLMYAVTTEATCGSSRVHSTSGCSCSHGLRTRLSGTAVSSAGGLPSS